MRFEDIITKKMKERNFRKPKTILDGNSYVGLTVQNYLFYIWKDSVCQLTSTNLFV